METIRTTAQALQAQGKVAAGLAGTSLGINVRDMPLDETVLVLLNNETTSIAARIGFGTSNLDSAPALAAGAERWMALTAGLASQLAAKPSTGSGVIIGYQVFRAGR